ncbi:MAG: precorrin-2 C(20)-methyltransferase, partial [Lachnospiraceae bacterium]|nr:precorrin-2 C(20)-methyltransferase [Lachnospiraceae bacterium]
MDDKRVTKRGCLYGVGVGPGDPELLTLKALRILNSCSVIAHPGKTHDAGVALDCVRPVVQEFHKKTILSCEVPMTKEATVLDAAYETNVSLICERLDAGEDVAFLNLGDPTIYGSYMTIHKMVEDRGYEAYIVPGVPSFCAAAAALEDALCLRGEELHVIPASYDVANALELSGTKV